MEKLLSKVVVATGGGREEVRGEKENVRKGDVTMELSFSVYVKTGKQKGG